MSSCNCVTFSLNLWLQLSWTVLEKKRPLFVNALILKWDDTSPGFRPLDAHMSSRVVQHVDIIQECCFFSFFLFNSPLYCFCRKDVRSHSTLCLSPVTQSSVKERSNAFVALRVNERTEVVSCTIVHVLCTQEGPSVYPSAKNRLLGDQSRGL